MNSDRVSKISLSSQKSEPDNYQDMFLQKQSISSSLISNRPFNKDSPVPDPILVQSNSFDLKNSDMRGPSANSNKSSFFKKQQSQETNKPKETKDLKNQYGFSITKALMKSKQSLFQNKYSYNAPEISCPSKIKWFFNDQLFLEKSDQTYHFFSLIKHFIMLFLVISLLNVYKFVFYVRGDGLENFYSKSIQACFSLANSPSSAPQTYEIVLFWVTDFLTCLTMIIFSKILWKKIKSLETKDSTINDKKRLKNFTICLTNLPKNITQSTIENLLTKHGSIKETFFLKKGIPQLLNSLKTKNKAIQKKLRKIEILDEITDLQTTANKDQEKKGNTAQSEKPSTQSKKILYCTKYVDNQSTKVYDECAQYLKPKKFKVDELENLCVFVTFNNQKSKEECIKAYNAKKGCCWFGGALCCCCKKNQNEFLVDGKFIRIQNVENPEEINFEFYDVTITKQILQVLLLLFVVLSILMASFAFVGFWYFGSSFQIYASCNQSDILTMNQLSITSTDEQKRCSCVSFSSPDFQTQSQICNQFSDNLQYSILYIFIGACIKILVINEQFALSITYLFKKNLVTYRNKTQQTKGLIKWICIPMIINICFIDILTSANIYGFKPSGFIISAYNTVSSTDNRLYADFTKIWYAKVSIILQFNFVILMIHPFQTTVFWDLTKSIMRLCLRKTCTKCYQKTFDRCLCQNDIDQKLVPNDFNYVKNLCYLLSAFWLGVIFSTSQPVLAFLGLLCFCLSYFANKLSIFSFRKIGSVSINKKILGSIANFIDWTLVFWFLFGIWMYGADGILPQELNAVNYDTWLADWQTYAANYSSNDFVKDVLVKTNRSFYILAYAALLILIYIISKFWCCSFANFRCCSVKQKVKSNQDKEDKSSQTESVQYECSNIVGLTSYNQLHNPKYKEYINQISHLEKLYNYYNESNDNKVAKKIASLKKGTSKDESPRNSNPTNIAQKFTDHITAPGKPEDSNGKKKITRTKMKNIKEHYELFLEKFISHFFQDNDQILSTQHEAYTNLLEKDLKELDAVSHLEDLSMLIIRKFSSKSIRRKFTDEDSHEDDVIFDMKADQTNNSEKKLSERKKSALKNVARNSVFGKLEFYDSEINPDKTIYDSCLDFNYGYKVKQRSFTEVVVPDEDINILQNSNVRAAKQQDKGFYDWHNPCQDFWMRKNRLKGDQIEKVQANEGNDDDVIIEEISDKYYQDSIDVENNDNLGDKEPNEEEKVNDIDNIVVIEKNSEPQEQQAYIVNVDDEDINQGIEEDDDGLQINRCEKNIKTNLIYSSLEVSKQQNETEEEIQAQEDEGEKAKEFCDEKQVEAFIQKVDVSEKNQSEDGPEVDPQNDVLVEPEIETPDVDIFKL